jgi:hypothetical protein
MSEAPLKRFKIRLYEGGLTSSNQVANQYYIYAEDLQAAIRKALTDYPGSILIYCAEE